MLLGKLFYRNAIVLPKKALLNDLFLILTVILLYVNVSFFKQVSAGMVSHITSPLLYCLFLILLANNKGFIVCIFSTSWLRTVGKVSFYTYLLHGVAIELAHLYLQKVINWKYNLFNTLPGTIMILILLYGGCIVYKKFLSLPVTK
jgi:peptidoglycan/LPS O-acetylase OafA/YrhL